MDLISEALSGTTLQDAKQNVLFIETKDKAIQELTQKLQNHIQIEKESGLSFVISSTKAKQAQCNKQLHTNKVILDILQQLKEVNDLHGQAQRALQEGDFKRTSDSVARQELLVLKLPSQMSATKIVKDVHKRLEEFKLSYHKRVLELFLSGLDIQEGRISIKGVVPFKESDQKVNFSDVIYSLDKLNLWQEFTKEFKINLSSFFNNFFQHNTFENPLTIKIMKKVEDESTELVFEPDKSFKLDPTNFSSKIPFLSNLYSNILKIYNFISTHTESKMIPLVSDKQLFDTITTIYLENMIPQKSQDLKYHQDILLLTKNFEEQLQTLGFDCTHQLSKYILNFKAIFSERKYLEALKQARQLIISQGTDTTLVQKQDTLIDTNERFVIPPIFDFPSCHITLQTQQLIQLIQELLGECKEMDVGVSRRLYECSRGILELYLSLWPVMNETMMTVPFAVVFHNDCLYIAHKLMILAPWAKLIMPQEIRDQIIYVDLVDRFRELGEGIMRRQMNRQKQHLEDTLSLLGMGDHTENFEATLQNFKQILHQFRVLEKFWKPPALPTCVYCNMIGSLIQFVIDKIINITKNFKDIHEEQSYQLHQLYTVLFSLENLFALPDSKNQIAEYVPQWTKFVALAHIFQKKLVDIVEDWNTEKLNMFSKQEIVFFIKALFDDNPNREQKIKALK
eukprot:TRINITY_DN26687_c0_g1_i1.p1 TRINITY_DN26687_c0_g1~~TRINITY_DN26687_c0_g1_i1.p1  ORF type:complete len:681 (+),score=170.09 TRINITY_DN26687_c0_g1_i1:1-2043(+)